MSHTSAISSIFAQLYKPTQVTPPKLRKVLTALTTPPGHRGDNRAHRVWKQQHNIGHVDDASPTVHSPLPADHPYSPVDLGSVDCRIPGPDTSTPRADTDGVTKAKFEEFMRQNTLALAEICGLLKTLIEGASRGKCPRAR